MAVSGSTKIRRQRVRRQRAESSASWWQRYRARVGLWPSFVFLVFLGVAIGIALWGRHSLGHSLGERIDQPIVARVDFTWVNDAQTEQDRRAARESAPNHYALNGKLINDILSDVQALYQHAKGAETFEAFAQAATQVGEEGGQALYEGLRQLIMDERRSEDYARWVARLGRLLQEAYTYRPEEAQTWRPRATGARVMVVWREGEAPGREPARRIPLEAHRLLPMSNTGLVKRTAGSLAEEAGFPAPVLRGAVRALLEKRLLAAPLLVYDKELTEAAMTDAADDVEEATLRFKRGDAIVSPAQDEGAVVLTQQHLALLQAEDRQYRELLASNDPAGSALRAEFYLEALGVGLVIVVLSFGLFLHVGLYQPRILEVRTRTLAFAVLVLAMLLAGRVIDVRLQHDEWVLVPAVVMAACLTIAYPRRFALGTTGLAALLLVQLVRGDIGLFVTLLVGLSLTVYWLNDIRTRTQIITAGLRTALAVSVVSFAYALIDQQTPGYAGRLAGMAAAATVAAALVVHGILPFIERAFRIATSLTLLEWSSADKPLLQRIAREAPGTYNHSLVLGRMAEAACEAIGANGLLVRVGALYHDVGKIHKSDYFAENQEASISRHDKLSASMSLLIILGHVKDGIELAREYGLPRVLHQFIEEHHGTTVVRYFHHKASEEQPRKASGKHDRQIPEAEFRYPGPKPHSKESAVLMICDGVESAVRSLSEPTAGRIESVVHRVIMDRLNDGQFGECEITLKELHTVEDSLVKSLCTFYHGRVAYPSTAPGRGEAAREEHAGGATESEQRRPA